jgi:DNA-binding XRE family transcriptional regulator
VPALAEVAPKIMAKGPTSGGSVPLGAEYAGDPVVLRLALRGAREVLDISQERWASLIGVSMTTVARWESANPKRSTVAPPIALTVYRQFLRDPEYRARLAQRPDVVLLCIRATLLPADMLAGSAA